MPTNLPAEIPTHGSRRKACRQTERQRAGGPSLALARRPQSIGQPFATGRRRCPLVQNRRAPQARGLCEKHHRHIQRRPRQSNRRKRRTLSPGIVRQSRENIHGLAIQKLQPRLFHGLPLRSAQRHDFRIHTQVCRRTGRNCRRCEERSIAVEHHRTAPQWRRPHIFQPRPRTYRVQGKPSRGRQNFSCSGHKKLT